VLFCVSSGTVHDSLNTNPPSKRVHTSHKLTERLEFFFNVKRTAVMAGVESTRLPMAPRVPNTEHSVSLADDEIQNSGNSAVDNCYGLTLVTHTEHRVVQAPNIIFFTSC